MKCNSAGGGDYPYKIAVFGMHNAIGDNVLVLKALYAIKYLYPHAILTILSNGGVAKSLFKYMPFIDEIINIQENQDYKNHRFDIVLLFIKHDSLEYIQKAKTIQSKRVLTTFSKALLQKGILFIPKVERIWNPYWKQRHRVSDGSLNLVRSINKKHFDDRISKIDFTKAEILRGDENRLFVESALKKLEYTKYQKLIGICPIGNSVKIKKMNFSLKSWIKIAEELAREFPQNLFIFMDYLGSGAQFLEFEQKNIGVFTNNKDLLNLVELTSRLHCLLSVNTGNVHIADNLRIPTLEIISKSHQNKWIGGSYGGICECIYLPKNWQQREEFYQKSFICLARKMIKCKI
ncbi:glycosyltransferase family 9 protein [Helicobacter rodentium]|uniref:glycosyltransferase family 9 protein n=1 Tax=Helicobacter rodentium TaxID=59617 RepID=UPI00235509C9|nr:hypothetical protein [Helicobacter rodentium]